MKCGHTRRGTHSGRARGKGKYCGCRLCMFVCHSSSVDCSIGTHTQVPCGYFVLFASLETFVDLELPLDVDGGDDVDVPCEVVRWCALVQLKRVVQQPKQLQLQLQRALWPQHWPCLTQEDTGEDNWHRLNPLWDYSRAAH